MTCPATGTWPYAKRWPTSPTSSPSGAVPHSQTVTRLSAAAAACLGLSKAEQDRLRRAGLVHDLGKIAMPYLLLEKAGDDTAAPSRRAGTAALAEPVRLHSYYAQRILARVRTLADLAADVGGHHERLDGSGYPLGLGGHSVPLGARVLAAADTWAERAGDGPPRTDPGLRTAVLAAWMAAAMGLTDPESRASEIPTPSARGRAEYPDPDVLVLIGIEPRPCRNWAVILHA